MKKSFFSVASLVLVLIVGGALVLFNTKPVYSDSSNFPIKVGEAYVIAGGGETVFLKVLTMPDSAGWMNGNLCKEGKFITKNGKRTWANILNPNFIIYVNVNNAFSISKIEDVI